MWTINSSTDNNVIAEIEGQSDRASALVASAFLENKLATVIRSRLLDHQETQDKMFRGTGPLASFSGKIDIGFLLRIYPEWMWKLFHNIRKIRNEFAHEASSITFNSQEIASLCKGLAHLEGVDLEPLATSGIDPNLAKILGKGFTRGAAGRKERFIVTVQFLMLFLELQHASADAKTGEIKLTIVSSDSSE